MATSARVRVHERSAGDALSGGPGRREVVVVGAGPVGLACALALRARDVGATVLDARAAAAPRPGSRAIYTHRASLALLERATPGLGVELARRGLVWSANRTLWRGREVYRRAFAPPRPDALPPFTSLAQTEVERLLLDACAARGVELVFDARVQAVAAGAGGVELRTAGAGRWAAERVVGADGARSVVRAAIGATLEGRRSEDAYVIVDVAEDPERPLPLERVFHYEHPAAGGRNVLLVPFRGGWRADLQCRRDDDPASLDRGDGLRAWIAAVLGERYAERIGWVSTYRFLQVVADRFADATGRVLLAGEAAHLFAPFGARGMNSGIADAHGAAEAIEAARSRGGGAAAPGAAGAVGRFAAERRAAAIVNRRAAAMALDAIQGRRPWPRARRRIAVALAPCVPRAGAWLDSAPYGPRLRRTRRAGY